MENVEKEIMGYALDCVSKRKDLCMRILRTNSDKQLIQRRDLAIEDGDVYTLDYCEEIMRERGLL